MLQHPRLSSFRARAISLFALFALVALASAGVRAAAGTTAKSGIDVTSIDRTCAACDDFYQFAEGNWLKAHPVPASESTYGNFTVLSDRNVDELHAILEDASHATNAMGSPEQKAGDYYASCMDVAAIASAGIAPIRTQLDAAAHVSGPADLPATIAELDRDGVPAFFSVGPDTDLHDSTRVIVGFDRGGLSLPDRDYYLKDDEKTKALRDAYVAHVTKMFGLLGDAPDVAAREAAAVLGIETSLATNSLSRVARRDPAATDHKMTLAQLAVLAPNFDWATSPNPISTKLSRRSSHRRRLRTYARICVGTSCTPMPASCPRRSTTRTSRSSVRRFRDSKSSKRVGNVASA